MIPRERLIAHYLRANLGSEVPAVDAFVRLIPDTTRFPEASAYTWTLSLTETGFVVLIGETRPFAEAIGFIEYAPDFEGTIAVSDDELHVTARPYIAYILAIVNGEN